MLVTLGNCWRNTRQQRGSMNPRLLYPAFILREGHLKAFKVPIEAVKAGSDLC